MKTILNSTHVVESIKKEFFSIQLEQIKELEKDKVIVYAGKSDEIPNDISSKICNFMFWDEQIERKRYYNYGIRVGVSYPFLTSNESILSAVNEEFCIIYKTI
ncbi:MAG: hypothetical protein ACOC3V_03810 [bacterium]